MHDRLDHHGMNDDASLAAALRALPEATPPADGWRQLAARTRRRRTTRHILWTGLPAALAACVALFIVLPHPRLSADTATPVHMAQSSAPVLSAPSVPHLATPAASTTITALQASSAQWQAWVATLDRTGAPLDGRALASAVTLQDRIGMIDLQLSAARNPATVAELWQQRITLLQQLGLVHLQPYLVAEQTRPTHAAAM